MVGTRWVNGLVCFQPLFGSHVLRRDWRRLEVAAADALVVRHLRVPGRSYRRLNLPVGHKPVEAQEILLLALVGLNKECTLCLCLMMCLRHVVGLVLILFVPTRRLNTASRLACSLFA